MGEKGSFGRDTGRSYRGRGLLVSIALTGAAVAAAAIPSEGLAPAISCTSPEADTVLLQREDANLPSEDNFKLSKPGISAVPVGYPGGTSPTRESRFAMRIRKFK